MNCEVCYRILGEEVNSIKLSCSCVHCVECLVDWTLTEIQELEYQIREEIPCMESSCKKPFKVESILNELPQCDQDKITQALFDVYLRKAKDIRKCPKDACIYAGIIDSSSTCQSPLECSLCETQWTEKPHFSLSKKIIESISSFQFDTNEFSSFIWEELFTKKCPKCYASIQKNGGCSHMICKRCGFDFCWYCSQENQTHKNKLCWINLTVKFLFCLVFAIQIIYLSRIFDFMLAFSMKIFNGVLEAFFLDSFLYIIYLFFPYGMIGRIQSSEKKIRTRMTLAIIAAFFFLVYSLDAVYSIFRIFMFQSGAVGIGLLYVDWFGKWTNNVY